MISPEQTEQEFDVFFESIGFQRVSEDVGSSPTFQNADYVHKERRIIVELKVLLKEHFENGGTIDSLNAIILKPESIDENGIGQYTFSLPKENREGKHDNIKDPISRVLKKANRQLRETKEYYFGNNTATGYVFLAQTGMESLSPEVTAAVIQKQLAKEFSEIDGAVICTPHFRTRNPFTLEINPECVSLTKNLNPQLKEDCMELADRWIEYFEKSGFTCI